MQPFDKATLEALLGEPFSVSVLPLATSTNTLLSEKAKQNEPAFSLLVAEAQNEGRGRENRHFFSPVGGAYFSLLVRPEGAFEPALLTALSAVCVCEAAEELGAEPCGIKWVNDVYANGKKCCGILTQGVFENGKLTSAVIGIGANLALPEGGFDAQIAARAGAFFKEAFPEMRERFIAAVCRKLYEKLPQGKEAFFKDYQKRSILIGKRVEVFPLIGGEGFPATVREIDSDCHLVVTDDEQKTHVLSAGEVSLVL